MSGPKVVRIVTREEMEANCRRHIKNVQEAVEAVLSTAKQAKIDDSNLRAGLESRLNELEGYFKSGQWKEIQVRGPQTVSFLQSEIERIQKDSLAAAAEQISKRRRLVDSARSLIGVYEQSGTTAPASLSEVISAGMKVDQEVLPRLQRIVDETFRALNSSAEHSRGNPDQTGFANRLARGEVAISLGEWLANRPKSSSAEDNRLDKLLAELTVFASDDSVGTFLERAAEIARERASSQRALLTDSLILDVAEHLRSQHAASEARARLREARASLAAIASPSTEKIEAAISAVLAGGEVTHADRLVAEARKAADREVGGMYATARRKAILKGLATLGYEIRETMETAWAQEGRLVVKKPGQSDYGVELGAPADLSRLQVRLVASEAPIQPRNTSRDKDEEIIWCGEFERLKALLGAQGGGVEIERAVEPGVQAVRTVSFAIAEEAERATVRPGRTIFRK